MARPKHKRYLTQEWVLERIEARLTDREVVERTEQRYNTAIARGFPERVVEKCYLDSPFLSENQHEAQMWIAGRASDKRRKQVIYG
jgi:hypothetical protein